jgi:hypothetical protein
VTSFYVDVFYQPFDFLVILTIVKMEVSSQGCYRKQRVGYAALQKDESYSGVSIFKYRVIVLLRFVRQINVDKHTFMSRH